jgi:hypothetical protein
VGDAATADSFRAFARSLETPLEHWDLEFFRARLRSTPITCTERDIARVPAGGCARAGDQFEGVTFVVWRSDSGGWITPPAAVEAIETFWLKAVRAASDPYGDGRARPYAVSFPHTALAPDSPRLYTAILTALHNQRQPGGGEAPARASLLTHWELVEGEWRLTGLTHAFVLGIDFVEPTAEGRSFLRSWERLEP